MDRIANPWEGGSGLDPRWNARTSPPVSADARNPWDDGAGAGKSAPANVSRQDVQTSLPAKNPWGDDTGSAVPARRQPVRADQNADDFGEKNPWEDTKPPREQGARTAATVAIANPMPAWSYRDPSSGVTHNVPEGYVLYRDPKTGVLMVSRPHLVPKGIGGDDPATGTCSQEGVGVILSACSASRRPGS